MMIWKDVLARIGVQLVVVVGAIVLAALMVLAIGVSPTDASSVFWNGTFGTDINLGRTLTQSVPFMLVALGWVVATRAGRLHVGFPGQVIIGGALATAVGLQCGSLPGPIAVLATALAGIVWGVLWAWITAWLWSSRGVLEIVSSLLLNLVAIQVAAWLVRGPLQGSLDGQPQSKTFPDSTLWPSFDAVPGRSLSYDVLLLPICAAVVVLVLGRTVFGFRLRAAGGNQDAARWSGVDPVREGVKAILISGGFAGLAGAALLFAGSAPWMSDGFEASVGFNGIAVALLARNYAAAVPIAAVLFSSLNVGGTALEAQLDIPSSMAAVLQGAVIVLVLVSAALMQRRMTSAAAPAASPPTVESSGAAPAVAGSGV